MTHKLRTLKPRVQAAPASRIPNAGLKPSAGMYNYRWQREREAFLRQNPLCVMCKGEDMVTLATVVDHVIPHQGDQALFWRQSNWQSLCAAHHSGHKQAQEHAEGYR